MSLKGFQKPRQEETGVQASDEEFLADKALHKVIEEKYLGVIRRYFDAQRGDKRIGRDKLRALIYVVTRVEYEVEEFNMIFKEIDTSGDGKISWDEFVSYLILSLSQDEICQGFQDLLPPVPTPPIMFKSHHRHPINKICFSPTMRRDRTYNWDDGNILTCSRDGTITYWSIDMNRERSVQSTCVLLSISPTWILEMIVLPDAGVVVTSSTERDLRFYDISANKFDLRVMFSMLDYAVSAMYYVYSQNEKEDSKLILGTLHGDIRVVMFNTILRGPFRSCPGMPLLHERFDKVMKNQMPGFRCIDFGRQHYDYVRQVSYYSTLHSIVSCSPCIKVPLIMKDFSETNEDYIYKLSTGIWCFALLDGVHVIATGGSDCMVRLWNPFVPNIPIAVLYGHHSAICQMQLQDNGKRLYSISKDRVVKVWDVNNQVCLQTYKQIPAEFGDPCEPAVLYNPDARLWILAYNMIAIIPLSPQQDPEETDGVTHTGGVSSILYNPLFKVLTTFGLDSYIIVWNIWDGRRMLVIENAHTKHVYGEEIPVEITSAAFAENYQKFVTAGHDGSIKIWLFSNGSCLRNLSIGYECEATCVLWVRNRVLAMGWNKCISEFAQGVGGYHKDWNKRHVGHISAGALKTPQTVATASFKGELVLWRLETGQAYKQINVSDPTVLIKVKYVPLKDEDINRKGMMAKFSKKARMEVLKNSMAFKNKDVKKQVIVPQEEIDSRFRHMPMKQTGRPKVEGNRESMIGRPEENLPKSDLSIHALYFLNCRPLHAEVATLLSSLSNGYIQVWSHHTYGEYMTAFDACHTPRDYVVTMTSSEDDEFLFTGSQQGYIKTWLLKNYYTLEKEEISMVKYRLIFPFLWGELVPGRAKRRAKGQLPLLLNSYRGHLKAISSMIYLDKPKILITGSRDCSVRMWTLSGRYIQTVGTFKPWKNLEYMEELPEDFPYSIPADLVRTASSTTLRVLKGGEYKVDVIGKFIKRKKEEVLKIDQRKIYGSRAEVPILGKAYPLPVITVPSDIILDTSFPHIPVYQHLFVERLQSLERPETPPVVRGMQDKSPT